MMFTSTSVNSQVLGSSMLQHLLQVTLLSVKVIFTSLKSMSCALLYFPFCADRLLFIFAESHFQNQPKDKQSLCPCPAAILMGRYPLKPTQRASDISPSLCLNCNIISLFILHQFIKYVNHKAAIQLLLNS